MLSVSVIIPAFNPGRYIEAAIKSVLDQTYAPIEIIVVDDESAEDLSRLDTIDPDVRRVRQANTGQAGARNRGMKEACGDLIAFLDQDDLWWPTKLARQITLLESNPNMPACHAQFDFIDGEGRCLGSGFGRAQDRLDLLEGNGVCGASSLLVRRSSVHRVGDFDTKWEPAEDYDWLLRLSSIGQIGFVETLELSYRKHDSNQSLNYARMYKAICRILKHHGAIDKTSNHRARTGIKNYKRVAASQALDQARLALHDRRPLDVVSHLWWMTTREPTSVFTAASRWLKAR